MKTEEFRVYKEQFANEPVIFFFDICKTERPDLKGLSREECIEKSHTAIPLSDFDTEWNDTDDGLDADGNQRVYIPDPQKSWCYVSMPNK